VIINVVQESAALIFSVSTVARPTSCHPVFRSQWFFWQNLKVRYRVIKTRVIA